MLMQWVWLATAFAEDVDSNSVVSAEAGESVAALGEADADAADGGAALDAAEPVAPEALVETASATYVPVIAPSAGMGMPGKKADQAVASALGKLPLEVHGFVESYMRGEVTTGALEANIQQVELDLAKNWDDRFFMRLDMQYDRYYGDTWSISTGIEQATVDVQVYDPIALKVGVGRFNAPFGWEMLDPTDKYAISHSMVFNYIAPFLYTGARVSFAKGPVDAVAYVAQGWEVMQDNNKDKTVGGRIGVRPHSSVYVGVSANYGSETADDAADRLSLDMDLTVNPHPQVLIGGEVLYRDEKFASVIDPGANGRALGGLVSVTGFLPDKRAMLTARWDGVRDFGGAVWGQDAFVHSATIAPAVMFGSHGRIALEYRGWFSDKDVFATSPVASPASMVHLVPLASAAETGATSSHTAMLQFVGGF